MTEHTDFIREHILQDMTEGVITIGMDGIITSVNPAALQILDRKWEELLGQRFARCFFECLENDAFNQARVVFPMQKAALVQSSRRCKEKSWSYPNFPG